MGALPTVVLRETYSPALEELADQSIWDDLPPGSAVWEPAASHNDCDLSEQREYRAMGLFVADRREALRHYEAALVGGGWSVEPVELTLDGQVLRATKPGDHGRLVVSVTASDRSKVFDIKNGELVPEGRPDGFDRDSDYLSVSGSPEPQCET